jgi:hypothetical protein
MHDAQGEPLGAKYLITLIHGTFDKGAAWTRPDSALQQALNDGLGVRAKVQAFEWTGHNTHGARLRAAKELAGFLDTEGAKHPGAKHVVIGHSHGGNVALYATNHIKDNQNLAHIICLATPFLLCGARASISLLTHLAWYGLSVLFAMPTAAGLLAIAGVIVTGKTDGFTRPMGMGGLWSFIFATAVVIYIAMRAYLNWSATRRIKSLAWSATVKPSLLAIFYRQDEAETYLSYLNLGTSRLARLLWNVIAAAFVAVLGYALLSMFLKTYQPALFNLPIFSTAHPWWGEGGGPPRRGAWSELVTLFFFGTLPLTLVFAYLLPVLRGNPWGYGWEWPSTTMMLDIYPVQSTAGIKTVQTEELSLDAREFAGHKGLAHSAIYQDPRVLQKIVQWIEQGPTLVGGTVRPDHPTQKGAPQSLSGEAPTR